MPFRSVTSFQSTATHLGKALAACCAFMNSCVHRLRWYGSGVSPRTLTLSAQPTSKRHMLKLTIHRIPIQSLQNDIYGCLARGFPLDLLIGTPNLMAEIKLRLDMRQLSTSPPPAIASKPYSKRVNQDKRRDDEIPAKPKE